MHPFDEATALTSDGNGNFSGNAPTQYWNVVGPYGGITAAILLRGPMLRPEVIGEPLALTVSFTAPVREVPFELQVHMVRGGRTTQHWRVEMIQPDAQGAPTNVAAALVVMGVRRDLWGAQPARPPQARPVEEAKRRDGRSGLSWFDRYDLRFFGNPMKNPEPTGDVVAWVRDEPPRSLDYPALSAICDTFFPMMFALRQQYVPIATVTMNTYFHASASQLTAAGTDYLLTTGRTNIYSAGFSDSEGQVWAGDRLIATSQQVMWYRE